MKPIITAISGMLVFAGGYLSAQSADDRAFKAIEQSCNQRAEAAFNKAKNDYVAVQGAFGGNISVGMMNRIEEDKPGFTKLTAMSCIADALRRGGAKTKYPMQ